MKKLGLRATARAIGISHVALLKAEKDGRVPRRVDQLFEVEACRAALETNSHPVKSRSARAQQAKPDATPAAEVLAEPSETVSPITLAEAIRRKEAALCRIREVEANEKEGAFVHLDDVERVWSLQIASVRQRLLGVPSRVANEVAVESSPAKCQEIVRREIYDALSELSTAVTIPAELDGIEDAEETGVANE